MDAGRFPESRNCQGNGGLSRGVRTLRSAAETGSHNIAAGGQVSDSKTLERGVMITGMQEEACQSLFRRWASQRRIVVLGRALMVDREINLIRYLREHHNCEIFFVVGTLMRKLRLLHKGYQAFCLSEFVELARSRPRPNAAPGSPRWPRSCSEDHDPWQRRGKRRAAFREPIPFHRSRPSPEPEIILPEAQRSEEEG